MTKKRVFGNIKGVVEGQSFDNRKALREAEVHAPLVAGITGSQNEGADSIVLSGGYADDEDFGNVIIYTGAGGQDGNKKQVKDQTLTGVNKALAVSCDRGLAVRVTRGSNHKSKYSPASGYRYDGLYFVDEYWSEFSKPAKKDGPRYKIWRYRLIKDISSSFETVDGEESGAHQTNRVEVTTQRIVRNTAVTSKVKKLYDYTCQVCGERLEGVSGPYAEGAHIKGLGRPHNGPDTLDNILCLCPNHHVLFDKGGISINDDLTINNYSGKLKLKNEHRLNLEYLKYHRQLWN